MRMLVDYSSDEDDVRNEEATNMETEVSVQQPQDETEKIVKQVISKLVNRVESRFRRFYSYRLSNLIDSDDSSDSDEEDDGGMPPVDEWFPSDEEDEEEDFIEVCHPDGTKTRKPKPCITKGELTVYDLPAIEKLNINVDVTELVQLGVVASIVDNLVVIESFKNIPALDLDTVLFAKDGHALGQIFDTIGPVAHPSYVLRFNSHAEALEMKFVANQTAVYYAERRPAPITKFVFVNKLFSERGCDASWEDDNEPPPEAIDFSDDETEAKEKWKHTAKNRHRRCGGGGHYRNN